MNLLPYLPRSYIQKKLETRKWTGREEDKVWIKTALDRQISLFVRSDSLRMGAPTQTHPSVYVGNWAMEKWPEWRLPCLQNMTRGLQVSHFGPARALVGDWTNMALKENSLEAFKTVLSILRPYEWQSVLSSFVDKIVLHAPYQDMGTWMQTLLTSCLAVDHAFPYVVKTFFETLPVRFEKEPLADLEQVNAFVQAIDALKNIEGWRGEAFAHALVVARIQVDGERISLSPLSQYALKQILQNQVLLSQTDNSWTRPIGLMSEKEIGSQWNIPKTTLEKELPEHPYYGHFFITEESELLKAALSETVSSSQSIRKIPRI